MINKTRNVVLISCMCMFIVCARAPQFSVKSQSKRNPAIIHERVGAFIEPEEREYYGLFHGIERFQEAVFFKRHDCGYDILILSERHTYYAIYDALQAEEILHDHIDSYDEINISRNDFEEKWSIVGYDTLGLPFTKNDVDRMIAKQRISSRAFGFGCLAGCLGACYACRDLEPTSNSNFSETHIPSCSFSGGEEAPYFCIGGFFTGVFLTYHLEKYFTKKNPIPHINKQRGPWIIE